MAASENLVDAVKAAIVASAHLAALEHVSAAAEACERLGALTSGRWRSAARDLDRLQEDLQTAFESAADAVASRAQSVGVATDALWTAGDAAATLDLLREAALEELDDPSPAARILEGDVLFGASFVEDAELPDRGTTLLFGWPAPLSPATWPWQANWVTGDPQSNGEDTPDEELDLYESGEIEGEGPFLDALALELSSGREEARSALRRAAIALTRASLLASAQSDDEGEDDDDED